MGSTVSALRARDSEPGGISMAESAIGAVVAVTRFTCIRLHVDGLRRMPFKGRNLMNSHYLLKHFAMKLLISVAF